MQTSPRTLEGSLSIIMPVYNEQDIIETVIADYARIAQNFPQSEIIVVNDASTDETLSVLKRIATDEPRLKIIANEKNLGHGPTLTKAYNAAAGDYIFHVDSDNQFVAEDFWLLWDSIQEGADVAIGRRAERHDPLSRLILTRCLKVSLFGLFGLWLPDSNSPFRLYRRSVLQIILPLIKYSAHLPSICLAVAAYKKGYNVAWINVQHLPRMSGQSFLRSFKIFRLTFSALGELLAFRKSISY